MGARVLRKREERQGIYMKRKVISALLACTLLAGSAVPALAAGETAAGQTPAGIGAEAPALKVRQMGVLAVKKAVQEDNSTVRILRKNASAIEDAAGGSSFGSASVSPGATYSELADTLEKILETGTLDGDTKKAYEAQITALRGNAENMNLSVSVQYQSALAMLSQLDDQAYQLRRQADSIANQMAMAAQNLLYTMETLDCQMESLKNGIATLDRNLAVMKVQRSRGMIGQLQLDTVENQRIQLVNSQQTLANMREQIGLSLSQLCGLDADTLVEPSTLIMPYEGELDRINAKTGLENAKKNSFDIWSRRVSLRAAQNVYDKNISGTAEAVPEMFLS